MKKILGKNQNRQRQTVEAYSECLCFCGIDCNPCSTVPAAAYISQRDIRLSNASHNGYLAVKSTF